MDDPNLLIPALVAFGLLIIGLLLTVYEFYTKRNIDSGPMDHTIEVVDPGSHRELGEPKT
ncbi:MAG: hypothetical protein KJO35_04005 [Gammaproteobacteria bacterium]|nr:hypothetical protein [Gammaproteobacteria bacterium]